MQTTRAYSLIDDELEVLYALKAHAEANVVPLATLRALAEDRIDVSAAYPPAHTVATASGLCVTFSLEEHPPGVFRHASFSLPPDPDAPSAIPGKSLAAFLLNSLGFDRSAAINSWRESVSDGRVTINFLQPIEGRYDPAKLYKTSDQSY